MALLPGLCSAVQTENQGLHAVPAPQTVRIDGDLGDWDRSGEILICYDLPALKSVYSARVAMMYDAEALYVGIDWTDATPMGNSHHPRHQAGKGWAGDCVQLRIKTDRIAHLTAWYYAPDKEPYIGIDYGKGLSKAFGGGNRSLYRTKGAELDGGAAMAFAAHDDGKGYVQEIRIPWKLITEKKRYAAGDKFQCGIEVIWGEGDWPVHRYADNLAPGAANREFFWTSPNSWGDVILERRGKLHLPKPDYLSQLDEQAAPAGPVPISYTLPKAGRVSLVIDDAQGRRVRNLLAAAERPAGRNVDHWDGLDDDGQLAPAGTYRLKGIVHDGIRVTYVMSFANPGHPSWDTPDGRGAFYADHTAPQSAAAAGDFVALACPLGESGRHLIGCDLDGRRRWGLNNRHGFTIGTRASGISLATDGKTVWVADAGSDTIYRVRAADGRYSPWNRTVRDEGGRETKVLDLPVGQWQPTNDADRRRRNLSAIACHDGQLAVCLTREDRVRLLDAETGDERAQWTVKAPRAVTFNPDGVPIVLSGETLLRLEPDGKQTPFTETRFVGGSGLACDADGKVYLAVRGDDQNVKVLSPDGKLIREIGKRGGRPRHGRFDPQAMRNPGQIAIDSRGRLWVPEETGNPKRTSVWSPRGELRLDLPGTTSYAGAGAIDPGQETVGFSGNTVYGLDLAAGTCRPTYSLASRGLDDEIFPASAGSRVRILHRDGERLIFTPEQRSGIVRCLIGRRDGEYLPAAALGVVQAKWHPESTIRMDHPLMRDHVGEVFAWADANGDGLVQPAELRFATPTVDGRPLKIASCYWGSLPGPDGTVSHLTHDGRHVVQFPVTGWTHSGAPIYDPAHPRIRPVDIRAGEGMVMGGGQGRVYFNTNPLTAIDADGRRLFTYPNRNVSVHGSHSATAARPGYLVGPSSILGTADLGGEVGEVFCLNGNLGQCYLFTQDGLWIQSLFNDVRGGFDVPTRATRGMSLGAITAGGESFGGHFVRAGSGEVYLTIGQTDARVLEVDGLDSIGRFGGTVEFTPQLRIEADAMQADAIAARTKPRELTILPVRTPPAIDGKLSDWPDLAKADSAGAVALGDEKHPAGTAAARYDKDRLYVVWRVRSPNAAMRNAGQDPNLLFKTGDAVDLMLGVDPVDENGRNLRLLIAPMGGEMVAMCYEPNVPGTPAGRRVAFSSPWRTIHMDRVSRLRDVEVKAMGTKGGYVVEAAIPWRDLGIDAKPGLVLRGDFGILSADSGGTTTVARQYWANKATGLVNDVPGEAQLTPKRWGTIRLK